MLACHAGGPGSIPGRCRVVFIVELNKSFDSLFQCNDHEIVFLAIRIMESFVMWQISKVEGKTLRPGEKLGTTHHFIFLDYTILSKTSSQI